MYCNVCQVYSLVLALLFVVRLSMSAVVRSNSIKCSNINYSLYSYVCLRDRLHGLSTCTLHNSETLEPLTWIRVCPSHRYVRILSLSLSLSLVRTHVLYSVYWTSVNIRHSNQSLDLSFRISTKLHISPYRASSCINHHLKYMPVLHPLTMWKVSTNLQ